MGLGRADSKSHQVLATGNGARVLHPFAVPRGLGACAPYRHAVSVAPSPVLGPVVSGARLSLSAGPTSQAPNLSREVSKDAPNPVVARHAAAASPWRRYPDQTHLRPAYADRGDHSRPQEPPIRVRAAVCANEASRALRGSAARRCTGFVHSVGAGSCRRRPAMGTAFSGQHRTAPAVPSTVYLDKDLRGLCYVPGPVNRGATASGR